MSKFRNIPSFFLIFISFAASFLMGCSGGGGGDGGTDSPTPGNGPAPAELANGMVFKVSGAYRFYSTPNAASFTEGVAERTITVVSKDSVTISDKYGGTRGSSVEYVRVNDNRGDLIIQSYPYSTRLLEPLYTTMRVELYFNTDTTGVAEENPVDSAIRYELTNGMFTYTPSTVVVP